MNDTYRFTSWFIQSWSRVGIPLGIVLLLLSPFLLKGIGVILFLVFLQLPVYMFHQYEEHAHGSFRDFINQMIGGGKLILSDTAIFWINILLVWVLDLCILYIAVYWNSSLGLIAAYLTLVNGLSHIIVALVQRRYNPGLWTSIVLFLPLGAASIVILTMASQAAIFYQVIGLVSAILVHGIILIYIRRSMHSLNVKEVVE
ncbi:MAG: HXXEE domain-containing protein [Ktedonobacteraceae bacterium]